MTKVFIPKETQLGETRVAATPETVKRLVKFGMQVMVESGAGAGSYIDDEEYRAAGAHVVPASEGYEGADLVLKVNPPESLDDDRHEVDLLPRGALLVSFVYPAQNLDLAVRLCERGVSVLAMEAIPRISRAQRMDALSSQSNLAGYKAVLMGADALGRAMPMMVTAAGTLKPAKVVVMGAGVAGLQAIATARRLGAIVEASDIRPEVKEQVESLGGRFIETVKASGEGGYAKTLTDEQRQQQQEIVAEHLVAADLVICTALIPGRRAPILVPAKVVERMKAGAVIVDLAVSQGGNCELAEPGRVVKHGVTIIGEPNVPALLPVDASAMYARNVLALVTEIVDKKAEGAIHLDLEDEIVDQTLIIQNGDVRHAPTREAIKNREISA